MRVVVLELKKVLSRELMNMGILRYHTELKISVPSLSKCWDPLCWLTELAPIRQAYFDSNFVWCSIEMYLQSTLTIFACPEAKAVAFAVIPFLKACKAITRSAEVCFTLIIRVLGTWFWSVKDGMISVTSSVFSILMHEIQDVISHCKRDQY